MSNPDRTGYPAQQSNFSDQHPYEPDNVKRAVDAALGVGWDVSQLPTEMQVDGKSWSIGRRETPLEY